MSVYGQAKLYLQYQRLQIMDNLKRWSSIIIWAGIVANMLFVIPLIFATEFLFELFKLKMDRVIWAQFSGVLLFILSIFYIPAALNIDRYRANAWFHCIPSRACGVAFFSINVFFLGAETGFLAGAVLDAFFGLALLLVLLKINKLEKLDGITVKLFS